MTRIRFPLARPASRPLLLGLVLLGGCARDEGSFPSLAARPAEKRGFAEPEARAPTPAAVDPALDGRIAALDTRLATATRGFDAAAARAEPAAARARGSAAGSESWIAAQSALSDLDSARADASGVVTDGEALEVERAGALLPDYPALEAFQVRARATLARQEALIARLTAALAPAG